MAKTVNNINSNQINKDKRCWIRQIQVTLTSKKTKQKMVFDNTDSKRSYNMDIQGVKKVSPREDNGVLTISNLEYDIMMKIVLLEYYDIEIKAGYKSIGDLQTIVKGEVSFISQKIHSKHDVDTYITYASPFVARYSQKRMNFNINSGFNVYGAMNYICQMSGIGKRVNIDPTLKLKFLNEVYTNYDTTTTVLDDLNKQTSNFLLTADGSTDGSIFNIINPARARKILVDPNHIAIGKGNPTVTSDGLRITLFPTRNYCPGDILCIDNGLIDVSIQNASAVMNTFNTNFLDQSGQYMILQIDYHFQNRGPAFEFNIQARMMDYIRNLYSSGGNK